MMIRNAMAWNNEMATQLLTDLTTQGRKTELTDADLRAKGGAFKLLPTSAFHEIKKNMNAALQK